MAASPPPQCPSCGADGSLHYVAQIFATACEQCGYIDDAVDFYSQEQSSDNYNQPAAPIAAVAAGGGGADGGTGYRSLPTGSTSYLGNGSLIRTTLSLRESRQQAARQHRPAIANLIAGTLSRTGHPTLADRANALFDQAKAASLQRHDEAAAAADTQAALGADTDLVHAAALFSTGPSGIIRWGAAADSMAAACCYAVIRLQGRIIDLETVASAAVQPVARVQRSFRQLKSLVGDTLRGIGFRHVDAFIARILAFFNAELIRDGGNAAFKQHASLRKYLSAFEPSSRSVPAASQRRSNGRRLSLADVEKLALDIGNLWWLERPAGVSPFYAAFACVILAFEAMAKQPLTLDAVIPYADAASKGPRWQPTGDDEATSSGEEGEAIDTDGGRRDAIKVRYHELLSMLGRWADKLPWIAAVSSLVAPSKAPRARSKRAQNASHDPRDAAASGLDRKELICHVADIVAFVVQSGGCFPSTQSSEKSSAAPHDSSADGEAEGEGTLAAAHGQHTEERLAADEATVKGRQSDSGSPDAAAGVQSANGSGVDGTSTSSTQQGGAATMTAPSAPSALANLQLLFKTIAKLESTGDALDGQAASDRRRESGRASVYEARRPRIEAALREGHDGADTWDRIGSEAHPLDLLSDEQVDELLFSSSELDGLFRSPAESDALARIHAHLGDWDCAPPPPPPLPASNPDDQQKPARGHGARGRSARMPPRTKAKGLFADQLAPASSLGRRRRGRATGAPAKRVAAGRGEPRRGAEYAEDGESLSEASETADDDEEDEGEVETDAEAGPSSMREQPVLRAKAKKATKMMAIVGPIDLDEQMSDGSDWDED